MTLGSVAAGALLGVGVTPQDGPKAKSQDTMWFESSLLQGIPVFWTVDPTCRSRIQHRTARPSSNGRSSASDREYLEQNKIVELAQQARQRREEMGLGLL